MKDTSLSSRDYGAMLTDHRESRLLSFCFASSSSVKRMGIWLETEAQILKKLKPRWGR